MNIFLRLLGARKRNQIKGGKLWSVTRLWGWDILWKEQEVPQPLPLVRPSGGEIEKLQNHRIKGGDNETNLTKQPELM